MEAESTFSWLLFRVEKSQQCCSPEMFGFTVVLLSIFVSDLEKVMHSWMVLNSLR